MRTSWIYDVAAMILAAAATVLFVTYHQKIGWPVLGLGWIALGVGLWLDFLEKHTADDMYDIYEDDEEGDYETRMSL